MRTQKCKNATQVLLGLREAWPDFTGVDDPFDADTNLYAYMKDDGSWDELDFYDVFRRLESFFGFSCTDAEWKRFFCFDVADRGFDEWERLVAPDLTFGALASFIAQHAVTISFAPATVLGRECAAAGAFYGIQSLVDQTTNRKLRFAPNDRIIDVLRGSSLDHFWSQLRWMAEHHIPPLPESWRNVTGHSACVGCLVVIVSMIAAWLTSNFYVVALAFVASLAVFAAAYTYKYLTDPLPHEIESFRDLANLIADRDIASSGGEHGFYAWAIGTPSAFGDTGCPW